MDIQFKPGEQPPASSKKKKFKLNKKNIVIIGGLGIVAFLVLSRLMRSNKSETVEYVGTAYGDEYGSNSVDTAAQMQNMSASVMGEVSNMLASNNATITDQINKSNEATAQYLTDVMQSQEQKFQSFSAADQDAANAFSQMFNTLQTQLNDNNSKIDGLLTTKPVTNVTPIPRPSNSTTTGNDFKKPITKQPVRSAEENQQLYLSNLIKSGNAGEKIWARQQLEGMGKTTAATPAATAKPATTAKPTTQKLNTATSIVDLMKSKGQDSSMSNRKKVAANLGIKNYTGTAAQNTQMIKLLNK